MKTMPEQLPIFRVVPFARNADALESIARKAFGLANYQTREQRGRQSLRLDSKVVELHRKSGGLWMADERKLWNPDATPKLPTRDEARKVADRFLHEQGLLPAPAQGQPWTVDFLGFGSTQLARYDRAKKSRESRTLDVQVNHGVHVALQNGASQLLKIPVVGGGGKFNVTLGDAGEVIGYSGCWRPIVEVEREAKVIPREEADKLFQALTAGMDIASFEARLAYFSAPASRAQELIYPVYVYSAKARTKGDRTLALRQIMIPATDHGPMPRGRAAQRDRLKPRDSAVARVLDALGIRRKRRPYEAGASWIGLSGGLQGSAGNAQGFVDALRDAGWNINFNWGDANAWESDWSRNDDGWVDAADFVFYTGHADMNGWVLASPDDGALTVADVGPAPGRDRWGGQDLEWVIVAACGPLQDELLAKGGGNVFARWDGAFDGLHQLLGYGAVTFDNEDEGRSVVGYARDGQPLIDAWFRTAREVQPSTNGFPAPDGPDIWVGAMYVERQGLTSPRWDHIWGAGSVAPDPMEPDTYVALWTTT